MYVRLRPATRGGGAKGAHPNCPACPPKLPFPLRQFRDGGFFFEDQQTTRKKVDQIGARTFFLEGSSTENLVKTRPTQKFWPPETNFAPLDQRSSCGTGQTADGHNW